MTLADRIGADAASDLVEKRGKEHPSGAMNPSPIGS